MCHTRDPHHTQVLHEIHYSTQETPTVRYAGLNINKDSNCVQPSDEIETGGLVFEGFLNVGS